MPRCQKRSQRELGAAPVVKAKLPSFESYFLLFNSVRAGLVRAHSPFGG